MTGGRLEFRKYYAEGNAYVVIEAQAGAVSTAGWIADATRGLGGDGLILIEGAPGEAMHHMRVFNADGSEAQWCGNGARAAAALIAERDGLREGDSVTITSGGGTAQHVLLDRETWTFRAEMPVPADPIVEIGEDRRLVQTLIGAPHLVVFGPRPTGEQLDAAGTALCAARPGGTNVMFASRDDDGGLTVTPWERGVGPVLGCATGAAAAAIAAERVLGEPLGAGGRVRQPGGSISVRWDAPTRVLEMTGGARLIATGELLLDGPPDGAAARAAPDEDLKRPLAGAPVTG
jgi:diaminopimelate epimerase